MTEQRSSQVVTEVLDEGKPNVRSSQVVAETLDRGKPAARASQVVAETLDRGRPHLRSSQVVVEVLCLNLERDVLPVFPNNLPGLGFSVKWSPAFYNMPTQTTATGADIDLALADEPLHDFELTYEFLRDYGGIIEFKTMMGFYLRMGGTRGRFLFYFKDDNYVNGQAIGTTDGVASVFGPIVRTYGVGDNSGTEAVGYLDLTREINVYLDGVLQDPSTYQLLTDAPKAQMLKFLATPTTGQAITMDVGYFYYCKVPENANTFEKFLDRIWNLGTVKIHSCREGA